MFFDNLSLKNRILASNGSAMPSIRSGENDFWMMLIVDIDVAGWVMPYAHNGVIRLVLPPGFDAWTTFVSKAETERQIIENLRGYFQGDYQVDIATSPDTAPNSVHLEIGNEKIRPERNDRDAVSLIYSYGLGNSAMLIPLHDDMRSVTVHVPEEMSRTVRKYRTWDEFSNHVREQVNQRFGDGVEIRLEDSPPDKQKSKPVINIYASFAFYNADKLKLDFYIDTLSAFDTQKARALRTIRDKSPNSIRTQHFKSLPLLYQDKSYWLVDARNLQGPLRPCFFDINKSMEEASKWVTVKFNKQLAQKVENNSSEKSEESFDYRAHNWAEFIQRVYHFLSILHHVDIEGFVSSVGPYGSMDIKKWGDWGIFEDYGNYHYGVVTYVMGIELIDALVGAGLDQMGMDFLRSIPKLKRMFTGRMEEYFDQKSDLKWIKKGFTDASKGDVSHQNCIEIDQSYYIQSRFDKYFHALYNFPQNPASSILELYNIFNDYIEEILPHFLTNIDFA